MQLQSLFGRTANNVVQVSLILYGNLSLKIPTHWENIANLKSAVPVGSRRTRRIFTSDIQQNRQERKLEEKERKSFYVKGSSPSSRRKTKWHPVSNKVTLWSVSYSACVVYTNITSTSVNNC